MARGPIGRPILTGLRPLPQSLQSLPWAVLSALKTPPSRAEGWERGTPPPSRAGPHPEGLALQGRVLPGSKVGHKCPMSLPHAPLLSLPQARPQGTPSRQPCRSPLSGAPAALCSVTLEFKLTARTTWAWEPGSLMVGVGKHGVHRAVLPGTLEPTPWKGWKGAEGGRGGGEGRGPAGGRVPWSWTSGPLDPGPAWDLPVGGSGRPFYLPVVHSPVTRLTSSKYAPYHVAESERGPRALHLHRPSSAPFLLLRDLSNCYRCGHAFIR